MGTIAGIGSFLDGFQRGQQARDQFDLRRTARDMAKQGLSMPEQMEGMAGAYAKTGNVTQAADLMSKARTMRDEGYLQSLQGAIMGKSAEDIKQQFNATGNMRLKDLTVEPMQVEIPGYGAVNSARLFGTTADGKPFEIKDAFGALSRGMDIGKQLDMKEKQLTMPNAFAQQGLRTEGMQVDLDKAKTMRPLEEQQARLRNDGMQVDLANARDKQAWAREDRPMDQAITANKLARAGIDFEKARKELDSPASQNKQWDYADGMLYNPYTGEAKPFAGKKAQEPDFYAKEDYRALLDRKAKLDEASQDAMATPEERAAYAQQSAGLDKQLQAVRGGVSGNQPATTTPYPKVGEVMDGHRYKGGDPNSASSWEAIQ